MTESVAIVIPALDEADNLAVLLDDCAAQQPPADEVVVVDAGSTDGTAQLLAGRAAQWPVLHVLTVPGASPGAARNAGIAHARSEVIAALDAGSRVAPGWLSALTAPVLGGKGTVAVGVPAPDAASPFESAAAWFTLRGFKPADRAAPLAREFLPAGRNGYCFRRSDWEAAGGYPDLRHGQDKLFLRRLRADGARIVAVPEAVVRWRPRSSLREMYRQYRGYGFGDGFAGVDRQNELAPMAMYAAAAWLARGAARGSRTAGATLALAGSAYLALFVLAAARDLGPSRAIAWIAPIRLTVDAAKIHGFLVGTAARLRGGGDGWSR